MNPDWMERKDVPAETESELGLADAIEAVRAEIMEAQQRGAASDVRFTVGDIELEFAVDVRKERGSQASVTVLNLLSLGGKLGRSTAETSRVKVVLNTVSVDGKPFEVASAAKRRPGG
jgi:hypothetical protein